MYTHHTINNQRFTVRLCGVAQYFNFKKVGSLEKFLRKHEADIRITWGFGRTVNVLQLLKEIEQYSEECKAV